MMENAVSVAKSDFILSSVTKLCTLFSHIGNEKRNKRSIRNVTDVKKLERNKKILDNSFEISKIVTVST